MKASIIICTCNRADQLQSTLHAIFGLVVPAELTAEVIVVDNAPSESSRIVTESVPLKTIPIRYIPEPRRGKGYAYNTGMANAKGDVLLFADDDVRPIAGWVERMCAPILSGRADAVQGGIRVPEQLRRPWMTRFHLELLASTEFFDGDVSYLVGANMAFGRHVLERVPGFDPALGPGALGFLDESLFTMQMKEAGYRFVFVPEGAVEHHFHPSRLSSSSFLDRALREGRSRAYVAYHWEHESYPDADLKLKETLRCVMRHRLKTLGGLLGKSKVSEGEIWLYLSQGFWEQMVIEQRRPRRYARHGLALLSKTCDESIGCRETSGGG